MMGQGGRPSMPPSCSTSFADMAIGPVLALPGEDNDYHGGFVARVLDSLARVAGRDLVREERLDPNALGRCVYFGNFALLTHRGDDQAMLNYGNLFGQNLWECDWEELTSAPSSATAPEEDHQTRDQLMDQVSRNNFVSGYEGRRVSFKGRLFLIQDVTVWRLLDASGDSFGVGAIFRRYRHL